MRRAIISLCILAATLTTVPLDVDAQGRPQTRQGFFIGFGVGGGSFGCEDCEERETGGAGHLKLGGTLSPQLLLGAESSAWSKKEDSGRVTHGNFSLIAQFYPSATSGFFLKAGLGGSRVEIQVTSGTLTATVVDEGFGLTAGLGYDIRLGTNFSLSPYGTYAWGTFDESTGGSFTVNHIQLGLGATFH